MKFKKLLAVLLVVLFFIPAFPMEVNATKYCVWGDVIGALDEETGILEVTGEGYLNDNYKDIKQMNGTVTSVNIHEGVTSIAGSTFSGVTSLKSISMPSSLNYIGASAFNGCTALTDIEMGDGVTEIESGAFSGCTSLKRITLPKSLTGITDQIFMGCSSLEGLVIPEKVTYIGAFAFSGTTELRYVVVPDSINSSEKVYSNFLINHPATCVVCGDGSWLKTHNDYKSQCVNSGKLYVEKAGASLTFSYEPISGKLTISGSGDFTSGYSFKFASMVTEIEYKNYTNTELRLSGGNYSKVKGVTIPSNVTSMKSGAFDSLTNLNYIVGAENSFAQTYAASRGVEFVKNGEVPKCDHEWNSGKITKSATCTEAGTKVYTCNLCGITKNESIPASGHSIVSVKAVDATCETPGNIFYYKCNKCDKYFSDSRGNSEVSKASTVVAAKGHTIVTERKTTNPGCETIGTNEVIQKCSVCGKELERSSSVIAPTGHSWGEWKVTKAATENSEGIEQRVCQNDPTHVETREIARLPHVHRMVAVCKNATCLEPGLKEHYRCMGCNKLYSDLDGKYELSEDDVIEPATGHKDIIYDEKIVKAPTCESAGKLLVTGKCAVCGQELSSEEKEIAKLGHSWGAWIIEKAATEESEGSKYRVCTNDSSHKEYETIPKLNHVHKGEKVARKESSCVLEGNIEYYKCKGCSMLFSDSGCKNQISKDDIVIPKKEHSPGNEIKEVTKEATCTEDGNYDLVQKCQVCGVEVSRKQIKIDRMGHDWGEWIIEKEATEDEEGLKKHICMRDSSHFESMAIPKKNHFHQLVFVYAKEPSCTEVGNKPYYKCESCSMIFDDGAGIKQLSMDDIIIPMTEHDDKKETKEKVVKPTCEKDGGYDLVRRCSMCDEEASREHIVVKKTGHSIIKINAASATADIDGNIEYYMCTNCNKMFSDANGTKEISPEDTVITATGSDEKVVVEKVNKEISVSGVGVISADGKTLKDLSGNKYILSAKLARKQLKKNLKIADKKSGGKYKIVKVTKKKGKVTGGMVEYTGLYNINSTSCKIPDSVKLGGVKFKVTSIGKKALRNNKKLKKLVIGSNISRIGTSAFEGCKSLKNIDIKSKKIKTIGSRSFRKVYKKVKVKVNKAVYKKYKKYMKKAGLPSMAKVTK